MSQTEFLGRIMFRTASGYADRLHLRAKWQSLKSEAARDIRRSLAHRAYAILLLVLFMSSTITAAIQPFMTAKPYQLSSAARKVLPEQNPKVAPLLKYDTKAASFEYNSGYTPSTSGNAPGATGTPRITASLPTDPSKGMTVTDPVSNVGVKIVPQYGLGAGKQDSNQILYPLTDDPGYLVYTAQITGVKEDILLPKFTSDVARYSYKLTVPAGMEARLEKDDSIGVYGSDLPISGNVSTGTANDAALLDKVRKSSAKTKLEFTLPAPVAKEFDKTVSQVKAHFELKGDELTLVAENLKDASFPLTIDPSVYVETAQKLMRGNNESNVDFDVTNELIQKGKLTGARFDAWTSTLALPSARWNQGTAVAGGYIYTVGGSTGTQANAQQSIYWAKFDPTTNAIVATNPGNGACSNWCTDSAYNLPVALTAMSVVAYNGYLYVFGGINASAVRSSAVYIAKIGVNGEPSLWHPTDPNKNNWVYWYTATSLSTERSYSGAVAYNNRMYLLGGQTNATTAGVTTVEVANINPIGTLSAWSTTGMTALPSGRFMHSVQAYNDRLYAIGGANGTTTQSTVYYIKINSDGTLVSSWNTAANALPAGRASAGGNFSTIWGGYMYIAGGCSTLNGSGYCTAIANDIQLASLNADGSLTDWSPILGVTSTREGYGLVAWRNTLYAIGGCTAQNTSTGACTTTATLTNYGVLNQDGDASTVSNTVANGTAPCASATWYDCDMPPIGNGSGQSAQMAGAVVVNNGFLYYIGGCYDGASGRICYQGANGKASGNTSYVAIAADGTLTRAAVCTGTGKTFVGSWCVDSNNTLNTTNGLAGFGYSIFNNVVYAVGGTTGKLWQSNVWRNTFASDGSIGTWSSQTYANLNMGNANGYQFVFTRANPSSASTYPGNLYVIGGCSSNPIAGDGVDCGGIFFTTVYKCNIKTDGSLEETNGSDCTTTGQTQLDSEPGTGGAQGVGIMAGTVYANNIYLVGGQSPNESQRGEVMYAHIDNSNNIVDVVDANNIWQTSANSVSPARIRGAAFGYNGYLYAMAGYRTGGTLNDLLFAKINVSDGSIGAFSTSTVTVNARWDLRVAVNNGYVYALGGCSAGTPPLSCTAMTPTIQTFQLYNNYSGSPAGYTAASNLFTTDRIGAGTVILNGYIYVAGGCTSTTDCTTTTTNVQYAALNPDGTVGTWANTTGALPAAKAYGKLLTTGGSLYYVGGQTGASTTGTTAVYYATPSSGNIASWSTASNVLPAARTQFGAAVWNNRLYVTGGFDTTPTAQTTIYASPTLSSGGDIGSAWTTTGMTAFNVARSGHTTIAYAGNMYVLGGYDGTNYLNDVQYAQISSSGTIGSWSYTTSLPQRMRQADGYAANGFMYLFGGRSADTVCTTNTYVAPISANTTIASGNNPTGVGEWYQTNKLFTGSRYGAAVAQNDGQAYVIGGGCGSTLTYTGANRVTVSAMQAQPQIAKYSRMIDTDTDVFPTKWLMNGLDNDIGARWKLRYSSSTNATAAWGQETNYGTVTLGTPDVYTPKDSGGTNTNFARYYYMSVSIDSSQAFGYPEDVTRGPTIADLTLFFTSDPSKRLRHGATFTGGELQPLDTPF